LGEKGRRGSAGRERGVFAKECIARAHRCYGKKKRDEASTAFVGERETVRTSLRGGKGETKAYLLASQKEGKRGKAVNPTYPDYLKGKQKALNEKGRGRTEGKRSLPPTTCFKKKGKRGKRLTCPQGGKRSPATWGGRIS